jgi:hypothetical protein
MRFEKTLPFEGDSFLALNVGAFVQSKQAFPLVDSPIAAQFEKVAAEKPNDQRDDRKHRFENAHGEEARIRTAGSAILPGTPVLTQPRQASGGSLAAATRVGGTLDHQRNRNVSLLTLTSMSLAP